MQATNIVIRWNKQKVNTRNHYNDVIMGAIGSQITSLTLFTQQFIQAQIKENIKALAFARGIHRWPLVFPHKWPVTRKCFHLMMSSYVARLCEISAILNNAISIPSLSKKNKFSKQLWLTVQYVAHYYCRWPGTTRCWGICRHSDIGQSIEINNKYIYIARARCESQLTVGSSGLNARWS